MTSQVTNHEITNQRTTLRTPAIARIRNTTNSNRNRPARNFAMANDAPAIDVNPRRPAMIPTTRNSSASCSISPPSVEVQLRVLYLHALEVVVAAFVAAEFDLRVLVYELVSTERFHFLGALVHRAAVGRRGRPRCCCRRSATCRG